MAVPGPMEAVGYRRSARGVDAAILDGLVDDLDDHVLETVLAFAETRVAAANDGNPAGHVILPQLRKE